MAHHIGDDKYFLKGGVFLVLCVLSEHVFIELVAVVEELICDKGLFLSLCILLVLNTCSILNHQLCQFKPCPLVHLDRFEEDNNVLIYDIEVGQIDPAHELLLQLIHSDVSKLSEQLVLQGAEDVYHIFLVLVESLSKLFVTKQNERSDFGLLDQSLDDVAVFVNDLL